MKIRRRSTGMITGSRLNITGIISVTEGETAAAISIR